MKTTAATSFSNVTAVDVIGESKSSNSIWIIGVVLGCIIGLLCVIIASYFIIKKHCCSCNNSKRIWKNDLCSNNTTDRLMTELQTKTRYVTSYKDKGNEDDDQHYVEISHNEKDSREASTREINNDAVLSPRKPIPKPRPLSLPSERVTEAPTTRKPIPTPRQKISNSGSKEILNTPNREAENELYGVPELPKSEEEIYAEPDMYSSENKLDEKICTASLSGKFTASTNSMHHQLDEERKLPCTSAKIFRRTSDTLLSPGKEDDENFALYIPVKESDVIYKLPSSQPKFDPPLCARSNQMEDLYTRMSGDEGSVDEAPSTPDYEEVASYERIEASPLPGSYQGLTNKAEYYQSENEVNI